MHMQNIKGDIVSDLLVCTILYPCAAVQMHDEAYAAEDDTSSGGAA